MATHFFSMFWGREDVYANRGKNGGYFPQCDNRWNELWKSTLLLIILRKRYKIFLSVFQQSRIIVATVMKVFSAKILSRLPNDCGQIERNAVLYEME